MLSPRLAWGSLPDVEPSDRETPQALRASVSLAQEELRPVDVPGLSYLHLKGAVMPCSAALRQETEPRRLDQGLTDPHLRPMVSEARREQGDGDLKIATKAPGRISLARFLCWRSSGN
jgi:hypothetical protein